MRVGIIQPNYIPWRGYFDFIDSVDLFIIHDDLQYTKGDWRNRNKIKSPHGLRWITVPVKYKRPSQLILETEIDYSTNWQASHLNHVMANYRTAPYIADVIMLLKEGLCRTKTISELNMSLIKLICSYLGIMTTIVESSDYSVTGTKTEKLINLLKKAGATVYLSGPSAKEYLDLALFRKNGIRLEYKTYNYMQYPQLYAGFQSNVSVIDLIANCGQAAKEFLKSQSPDVLAVE